MSNLVIRAEELSKAQFSGRKDKAGVNYYSGHLCSVASLVDSEKEKTVAFLHDILEDTDYPEEKLRSEFGDEIVEERSRTSLSGAVNLRILVVDDTEMNVDLLVRILRSMGFETDTAPDGEKALEHIRKEHFDLIFMDHMMPVMDGMEAMKIIREEKLCEDIPVIMLTANTIKGEKEKYIEAGFDEYLTKPFTDQSIKEVVLKYLPVDEERINQSSWAPEWRYLQKELPFLRLSVAKERFLSDADFFIATLYDYATSPIVPKLEEYITPA